MTLEAGKEMDRRCVLNWLNEVYVTPSRAFDEYTEYELKMFAHDALVLLEEREPVRPRVWVPRRQVMAGAAGYYCPVCDTSVVRGDRYCHWCGRELKWDE